MIKLTVNGAPREVDADPDTPLLWVIREWVGLTGTKYGCGIAECGACSVHIDGVVTRSCSVPAGSVGDAGITTIEGLSPDGLSHPVQLAWLQHEVPQCGYCQSGQIMAAAALLKDNPNPTEADVAAAMTNICRCGTYQRIKAAIDTAATIRSASHRERQHEQAEWHSAAVLSHHRRCGRWWSCTWLARSLAVARCRRIRNWASGW